MFLESQKIEFLEKEKYLIKLDNKAYNEYFTL